MVHEHELSALKSSSRFLDWLETNVPAMGDGQVTFRMLEGGTSNIIVLVERGGRKAILRRPPALSPPNSTKAMSREARVLGALRHTNVPHAQLYGFSGDESIIGAPFYLMEFIEGWSPKLTATDCVFHSGFDSPAAKFAMGIEMTKSLAALALVDHQALGLSDFGHPDGFLRRQVGRWLNQLNSYKQRYPGYAGRVLPGLDYTADWLGANTPCDTRSAIIHADYGLPNIIFSAELPVKVAAIIDWEMATIGDPLLDLALVLMHLKDADRSDRVPKGSYFDSREFPSQQETVGVYAQITGFDVSHIDYYIVLAQFRHACILEYKVAASTGQPRNWLIDKIADMVVALAEQAWTRAKACDAGHRTII
jgi:aminoglycoside phosphotransferase (APT) family kinase protein